MKSYQATWEDAEASRHVELVVNYRLDERGNVAGRAQRRHSYARYVSLREDRQGEALDRRLD